MKKQYSIPIFCGLVGTLILMIVEKFPYELPFYVGGFFLGIFYVWALEKIFHNKNKGGE